MNNRFLNTLFIIVQSLFKRQRRANGVNKPIGVCFWGIFIEDNCKDFFRSYVFINGLKKFGLKVGVCNKDISWLYRALLLKKYKNIKNKLLIYLELAIIFLIKFFIYLFLCAKFIIKHNSCDVIITGYEYDQDVIWAKALARLFNKKLIFNALNSNYETSVIDRGKIKKDSFSGKHLLDIDRVSFKYPDIIIVDTNQHKKYFSDTFNSDINKYRVIYVGADEKIFNVHYNKNRKDDSFKVVFYSIYTPLHGVEYIVDAANILRHEKIEFMLIGNGQCREDIEKKIKNLKLNNIELLGYLKTTPLVEELKKYDIGLGIFGKTEKCSRVIPNKVFQMMMFGLPVITGDTAAIREVFKDKEHCIFCKVADGADLAEKIMLLKNNKELRNKIAKNGKELVLTRFNTDEISEKLYNIINELAGK